MVSRWSISGFLIYVLGVHVFWQLKLQKSEKSVSLSSWEVKYIALSKAVKEVMFVVQLLGSMQIAAKYPITIRLDNMDAIFMASNITATCHTKHVEIR